jgi:hypothetical protein
LVGPGRVGHEGKRVRVLFFFWRVWERLPHTRSHSFLWRRGASVRPGPPPLHAMSDAGDDPTVAPPPPVLTSNADFRAMMLAEAASRPRPPAGEAAAKPAPKARPKGKPKAVKAGEEGGGEAGPAYR